MWTQTRFTEVFGLAWPIVQGPFGGGNSSVALAAAVSNAGGLGSFGAVDLEPDEITRTVHELAQATAKPFAINLWLAIPEQENRETSDAALAAARERVRPYYAALGAEPPIVSRAVPSFEAQVEALLEARPPVFSFVMGVPDAAILREVKRRGIRTIGTASTVDEAQVLAAAGVDAVVASGSDAGGHRGSFLRPVENSLVGTFSLVPQVVSAIRLPVLAAGGIADGRGIAAALALGAEGVQIGTAFLACAESGASPSHRQRLGQPEARHTRLTRVFSGRHARGIENELMRSLEREGEPLPFPLQNALTAPLRKAASAAGQSEWLALWAGQNAASARKGTATNLMHSLVEETDQVLSESRLRPHEAAPRAR